MASVHALGYIVPAVMSSVAAAAGYAGYCALSADWPVAARVFLTGPGRTRRVLLLLFVLFNWKSMPLMWTVR